MKKHIRSEHAYDDLPPWVDREFTMPDEQEGETEKPPRDLAVERPGRLVFTVRRTAIVMQVTPQTVYRWIRDGRIDVCHTPGGSIRVFADSLAPYLRARRPSPTAPSPLEGTRVGAAMQAIRAILNGDAK
jgi:hypothetical protein